MTYALWIVQGLLALLFLFTGGVKLVLPLEVLTEQFPLPGLFVRFLGVAEVLGAVGLILPGLLGIRPGLTPLAAAGLLIIMMGATVITLAGAVPGGGVAPALIPLVVGLLSAFVAYGRWRLTPHRGVMGAGNAGSGQRPSTRGSRSAQFGVPNDGPGLYGGK
jgi:DoxX-like family